MNVILFNGSIMTEYRVWLHSCENGWEVVFPPFLMVPSYQSLSIEETYLNKLEVGTFFSSSISYMAV
jgi:hypothetical protein